MRTRSFMRMGLWLVAAAGLCGLLTLGTGAGDAVRSQPAEAAVAGKSGHKQRAARAEHRIRACANHRRSRNGVAPVKPARKLNRAARMHARNMARRGFFSHTDHLGRRPLDRVRMFDRAGLFVAVGENIAAGFRSVRGACRGWMRSPGDRQNMLRRGWTHIGVGFAMGGPHRRYYVQVFGSK